MKGVATATWRGSWKEGEGTIATARPTLPETPYTYASRFEEAAGAAPEELFAAAYAGCLNQALANVLGWGNFTASSILTTVEFEVQLGVRGGPPGTVIVHIEASIPVIREDQFQHLVTVAVGGCLMSRMLRDAPQVEAVLRS